VAWQGRACDGNPAFIVQTAPNQWTTVNLTTLAADEIPEQAVPNLTAEVGASSAPAAKKAGRGTLPSD
jgi:hypothetical protein